MNDYYERCFENYHRRTFFIDPTSFLTPLTRWLSPPSHILDIGCGSGRDLAWFQQRGYRLTGLERSAGLARLARDNTGIDVLLADFDEFDFSTLKVDGLLLIGSLVHVPHPRFPHTLKRMLRALCEPGFILCSMKEGNGCSRGPDGRVFYLWQDTEIKKCFDALGLDVLHESKTESQLGNGEIWLSYVLGKSAESENTVNESQPAS